MNDGRVRVSGDFSLDSGPLRWRGALAADNVRVTEGLGRPLSFIVPILRTKLGDSRRHLTGVLDAKLEFRGIGTTYATLAQSLSGGGSIGFRDVELQGSLLLPLLSLRIDQLLTDRSYRFSDLNIQFGVKDGRVRARPFELRGEPFGIKLEGEAGLDGSLDFLVQPALLPVPLRVKGTLDKPKVRPDPLAGLPFR